MEFPDFRREFAKYRNVPKDVLRWQEVRQHFVAAFSRGTLILNLNIHIFQDTIRLIV